MIENVDKGLHCTKMGADSAAENTPKCPRIYLPNLSAQAQVLNFNEKRLHWASVVRGDGY